MEEGLESAVKLTSAKGPRNLTVLMSGGEPVHAEMGHSQQGHQYEGSVKAVKAASAPRQPARHPEKNSAGVLSFF